MQGNRILLILLVIALLISLPTSVLAKNELSSLIEAQKEKAALILQQRQEIRSQRADAHREAMFWFRTHPRECLLPQEVVDDMVQSGGYLPSVVKGLVGTRNPFFEEFVASEEMKTYMRKQGLGEFPPSPCDPQHKTSP